MNGFSAIDTPSSLTYVGKTKTGRYRPRIKDVVHDLDTGIGYVIVTVNKGKRGKITGFLMSRIVDQGDGWVNYFSEKKHSKCEYDCEGRLIMGNRLIYLEWI
jgi:hypothetical protein